MSRDVRLVLKDILERCARTSEYVREASFEQFLADQMVHDAVLYNLTIIGEAARNVPTEMRGAIQRLTGRELPHCATSSFMSTSG